MEDFFQEDYDLTDSKILFNESISSDFTQQLVQIRTILANSTFNIHEMVNKKLDENDGDDDDDYIGSDDFFEFNENYDQKNFEFSIREEDGRINLAYERLPGIPKKIADQFALRTHTLDLSYNIIRDLSFLANFAILHTLILDNNISIDANSLPHLPSLRIFWLNKCGISHLSKCLHRINLCAPMIRQLSLMGNPCARTLLNGSPPIENNNYIIFVIRNLPNLDYLDDVKITDDFRFIAKACDDNTNNMKSSSSINNVRKKSTKTKYASTNYENSIENLILNSSGHYYN